MLQITLQAALNSVIFSPQQTHAILHIPGQAAISKEIDKILDHHQNNVTETSGHRIWHKKYKHIHNTCTTHAQHMHNTCTTHAQHRDCESGYSSVKQSSRYVTHSLHGWAIHRQHIMSSTGHTGHNIAYTVTAWTDEVHLSSYSTCVNPNHWEIFNTGTVSQAAVRVMAPSRR